MSNKLISHVALLCLTVSAATASASSGDDTMSTNIPLTTFPAIPNVTLTGAQGEAMGGNARNGGERSYYRCWVIPRNYCMPMFQDVVV